MLCTSIRPKIRLVVMLSILAATSSAVAQIITIPSMTVPATQMTFDAMPLGTTTIAAINSFYGTSIVSITANLPLAADGTYNTNPQLGRALGLEPGSTGNLAIIDPPSGIFGGGNGYIIELGAPSTEIGLSIGDWGGTKDVMFYDGGGGLLGMTTVSASGGAVMNYYQSAVPFTRVEVTGSPNYVLPEIWVESGLYCTISTPASPAAGDITFNMTTGSPASLTVDLAFEYSLDGGMTYQPCTAGTMSPITNPALGVPIGAVDFDWDSVADGVGTLSPQAGVLVRATVSDATSPMPATCTSGAFDVDNVVPPGCMLVTPASPARDDIALDIDTTSGTSPTVDIDFEYSVDAGATWLACTPGTTSPLANPALATPVGLATFDWDSRADAVGLVVPAVGVLVRATVDDGMVMVTGQCTTAAFDVDNTSLCTTICGDCNIDTFGPTIVDALTAAQIAAGISAPTMAQMGCCDIDSSMTITIIDSLGMAQSSAGLPVTLTCP